MTFLTQNIDPNQWNALVKRSPDATPFQTPEGHSLYAKCPEYESFAFGMEDNKRLRGIICGAIHKNGPRGINWFTRRAIVFGAPIIDEEVTTDEMKWFLEKVVEQLKGKAIYLEFRFYSIYDRYREAFDKAGMRWVPELDALIETNGFETNIQKRKRRQIRAAIRMGVKINENPTEAEIRQFYPKFKELHWRVSHRPLPSVDFFLEINNSSIGKIILVEYDGKVIGMSAFLVNEEKAYYLYECGDNERVDASSVVCWGVLKWCAENGIKVCDTMGAGAPDKEYGVREFKRRMGGKLINYGRARYLYYPTLYRIATRITGADENLPGQYRI